jgi:sec-independent protein translocase protein TatB
MFDLGIGELLLIGIFALIFVGPKDFTKMFRELGRFTAKIRRMARDFQRAMEDAADETGMKETAQSLKKMTSARELGLDAVKDAAKSFDRDAATEKAKTIGPETAKMTEERAEAARKIQEYSAKKTAERRAAEAAEAAAKADPPSDPPAEPKTASDGT